MRKFIFLITMLSLSQAIASQEYLVKMNQATTLEKMQSLYGKENVTDLRFNNWVKVAVSSERAVSSLSSRADFVEPNKKFKIQLHRPQREDGGGFIGGDAGGGFIGGGDAGGGSGGFIGGDAGGGFIGGGDAGGGGSSGGFIGGGDAGGGGSINGGGTSGGTTKGDPDFPSNITVTTGPDVDYAKQWGMADIGVREAWQTVVSKGSPDMIVAVIDTGLDYTHEDLIENTWRNPGESGNGKETNGIDDDGNGFVDDVVGWDFAANDNKPYDTTSGMSNPGHGTHVSGIVAARSENGKGVVGVAPNIKIMAMRFITEKGSGSTDAAVQAIKYAVDNGAKVLSNSWGSEGDDGGTESQVLQEAIQYAQNNGVLFVAAAGNSSYNNDTPAKASVPASYPHDNIISVAAVDRNNRLASFSSYGLTTVDIAAPGVDVYSSIPKNKYMNMPGTSMACPHVSGAAALYWSHNPQATMLEVKAAILKSAVSVPALQGKVVTGGKLNVKNLITQ